MPKAIVNQYGNHGDKYLDTIRNLALFANVKDDDLKNIISHSHIQNYSKGVLLFLESEVAIRFYVVLEGWVKMFNGNIDGAESVIQMIGPGKTIAETSVLLNTAFPTSAKVVEDAKILSIPASIIREKIKHNSNLAQNMLISVASHSQELLHQIGQINLKTSQQRVAWFLLNLFLENGKRVEGTKLPYDKSLIASYLGMKPETFSRALQNLKEEGNILIKQNNIILSRPHSLCEYCDTETASKCNLHNNDKCINPDL